MASLTHQGLLNPRRPVSFPSPKLLHGRNPSFPSRPKASPASRKIRVSALNHGGGNGAYSLCCSCTMTSKSMKVPSPEGIERPPFDINLAVILAGFAFEAYWSPPENVGKREVDAADCQTVYLSGSFLREIYDGQLFVKLKKGFDFPAMDPWGTSDPYVVMQLDSQVVKSKVKWGMKSPTWNEELILNVKQPPDKNLEVAAWDANLVTPHKRMGNARVSLDGLYDGNLHEVLVELEGMGGGGKIQIEVKYKSYDELDEDKKWWKVPFVTEFLRKNNFEPVLEKIFGSETVKAGQFVQYAFGQLKTFNEEYFRKEQFSYGDNTGERNSCASVLMPERTFQLESSPEGPLDDPSCNEVGQKIHSSNDVMKSGLSSSLVTEVGETEEVGKHFWKNLADAINQNVAQKLGVPVAEKIKWDGFDLLNKMGSQSQKTAEAGYIESGLATPEGHDNDDSDDNSPAISGSVTVGAPQSSLPDIKKATQDILRQTDSILGALMVLAAVVSQPNKEAGLARKSKTTEAASTSVKDDVFGDFEKLASFPDGSVLSEQKAEEMKTLFSTAESAMEAWAMLATSLGHPTFIKSEFEKLCFLDNPSTDTQVAIWRDSARKRLVIAFRGTEQARWKDLRTDLMLAPAGLNPERIGGDFKQEVQVHSGFLSAYDSVRTRIMSLIKLSIGFTDDVEPLSKWHVYVTGHSLGGALATLLALELSSSKLVKHEAISVTMYNFGSPRVGNKRFTEIYNEKVKDSWRVVNHRDIIPTVPHLMGYCHVAQPIYLAAGNRSVVENAELLEDGYHGDVIGECTPDIIVSEFMKGEKELIEKLLQTEINIFRSIRDGTALMQHMEDFYYIALLENVRSNYQTVALSKTSQDSPRSIG